jgi:hypothetical protein
MTTALNAAAVNARPPKTDWGPHPQERSRDDRGRSNGHRGEWGQLHPGRVCRGADAGANLAGAAGPSGSSWE